MVIEINSAAANESAPSTNGHTALVTITHYSDPFSPWSAGFRPVLEQLKSAYGDQILIERRMGGLARNIAQWTDEQGLDSKSVVDWVRGVSDLAQIAIDPNFIAKTGVKTTWVGALAFIAASKHDPEMAISFLSRMIDGFQVESLPANRETVGRLADEVGLDGDRVLQESFHESTISEFAWQRNAMERAGLGLDSIRIDFESSSQIIEKEFSVENYERIIEQMVPGIQKTIEQNLSELSSGLASAV